MTLKVDWSEDALADVQEAFAYIANDSVQNAHLVADRIDHTVSLLAETPFGKPGRVKNTYEVVVPKTPFIIAYQLTKGKALSILRIIHGARDWREGEWPR
jgi:toxin ParE1/3/4